MMRTLMSRAVSASRQPRVFTPDAWYALVALAVPAFTFLYGLDAYPLRDNNEGLYAEIAREMLATGQYEDQRAVRDSSWYIARIILSEPTPPGAVLIYRDFEDVFSTLPFYLKCTVPIVDSGSRDLMFGCARDHGVDCLTPAQFRRRRATTPVAVAVQAARVGEFLAMAGNRGWRVEQAGDRMVFFDTR